MPALTIEVYAVARDDHIHIISRLKGSGYEMQGGVHPLGYRANLTMPPEVNTGDDAEILGLEILDTHTGHAS